MSDLPATTPAFFVLFIVKKYTNNFLFVLIITIHADIGL
jgi:hypothetical protein